MAEWSSVVVVEAKSLALVCTKDQNRFCFSIWNQNNFPPQKIPKWKRKKKRNPQNKKQKTKQNWKKLNTFQVIRTNNCPMIFILV